MATWALTENFRTFFGRLNPAPTWVSRAASQYAGITSTLENVGPLTPKLFLQGSYRRDTAIHTINDVDIVAICALEYPGSGAPGGRTWSRDEIFEALAAPLRANAAYAGKVRYGAASLCIKLDLGIQVEILPAVFKKGNSDPAREPFYIYRPEQRAWVEAFARVHQEALTTMNKRVAGNFIPAIKVFKHLNKKWNLGAVSFHIECLLHAFPDASFSGGTADYTAQILNTMASHEAGVWPGFGIKTPAGDRLLFSDSEWNTTSWATGHAAMKELARAAWEAKTTADWPRAVQLWRWMLGEGFFPA